MKLNEGTALYLDLVREYFISRMFTEENAKLISEQDENLISKFIELEKVKTMDEILNTIDKIKIPVKKKLLKM